MNQFLKPTSLLLLIVSLSGCFPRPYQQRQVNRFNQLKIGMQKVELQRIFPKLYPLRQRILPNGGRLETYRIRKTGWGFFFFPLPLRFDEIDFVFENDRLMEWGQFVPDFTPPPAEPSTQ